VLAPHALTVSRESTIDDPTTNSCCPVIEMAGALEPLHASAKNANAERCFVCIRTAYRAHARLVS
jgi:hypothetical protein